MYPPQVKQPDHRQFVAPEMTDQSPEQFLSDLRVEIDRIDSSIHELLMERGRIIDRLIEVKGRQGGGSAFRPGREASMMRNLLSRHRGLLPLDTIEGIWRIIISTFTYVQSNFSVHADTSAGETVVRDCVRFHFGFTVPFIAVSGVRAVIEAVARSSGDLGLVPLDGGPEAGAWWSWLTPADAPKIIARLPLVARQDHPASLPAFVISRPLAEAASREVLVHAIAIDRWNERLHDAIRRFSGTLLGSAADGMGLSLLISAPGEVNEDSIRAAFAAGGAVDVRISEIGSHAAVFELSAHKGVSRAAE